MNFVRINKNQVLRLVSSNKRIFFAVLTGVVIASASLGYVFYGSTKDNGETIANPASEIKADETNQIANDNDDQTKNDSTPSEQTAINQQPSPNNSTDDTQGSARTTPQANPSTPNPSTPHPSTPKAYVTISANGCTVTASATPGFVVTISAATPDGSRGWEDNFTIPASGTIIQSTGGEKGMISTGTIRNSADLVVATASAPITADLCPAPSY